MPVVVCTGGGGVTVFFFNLLFSGDDDDSIDFLGRFTGISKGARGATYCGTELAIFTGAELVTGFSPIEKSG